METSNKGQLGIESIRLGGMKIQDLPIAELARSIPQLKIVEDAERQKKISDILDEYPNQRVAYLDSRVEECNTNIDRMAQVNAEQETLISEYTSIISLCKFRDKELEGLTDKEKIKELKKKFPPYNVKAMETQIEQSKEAIVKVAHVVSQEYDSIVALKEKMALCIQRDVKLRNLGVKIAVG